MGVSGETNGVILTPLVLHQLSTNIRLEWARDSKTRAIADVWFRARECGDNIWWGTACQGTISEEELWDCLSCISWWTTDKTSVCVLWRYTRLRQV